MSALPQVGGVECHQLRLLLVVTAESIEAIPKERKRMRTHTKTTTAKALVINGVVLHPDVTIELVVDAIER